MILRRLELPLEVSQMRLLMLLKGEDAEEHWFLGFGRKLKKKNLQDKMHEELGVIDSWEKDRKVDLENEIQSLQKELEKVDEMAEVRRSSEKDKFDTECARIEERAARHLAPQISRSRPRDIILCCGVFSLAIFIIIFPLVIFFFIVNMVEIPTVKIESITVSNFNLSNPNSAHLNINMSMHNNRSSFEFFDSALSVFHQSKEEALWMARLKGFDMRPENTTVHFALYLGGLVDINDTTVRAIGDKITNNHGAVEFNVQFKADHPRSRNINPFQKYIKLYETKVKMLIISCDVLLLFESPDNTWAHMLMTNNQECTTQVYK